MSLSACDPIDDRLVIVNETYDTAYYLVTEFERLEKVYNQELADHGIKLTFKNYVDRLEKGGKKRHIRMGSEKEWENFIQKVCDNRKLHIYTFDADTLRNYTWKEIIENNYFKEKMSYSLADIERMNWEIELE